MAMGASINDGIYNATDVARILGLPYPRVRHWIKEFWDKRFARQGTTYSFGPKGNKAINFLTLIEFYTFYKLRERNVSAQKIQKIREEMSGFFETRYPFALSNISTEGKKVWYEHLEAIVQADGKLQGSFKQLIEPFLNKIQFDNQNVPAKFSPLGKGHWIVIDPKIQFGQPVIQDTRIPVETIFQLIRGGEKEESICKLYDIPRDSIEDVKLFYSKRAA